VTALRGVALGGGRDEAHAPAPPSTPPTTTAPQLTLLERFQHLLVVVSLLQPLDGRQGLFAVALLHADVHVVVALARAVGTGVGLLLRRGGKGVWRCFCCVWERGRRGRVSGHVLFFFGESRRVGAAADARAHAGRRRRRMGVAAAALLASCSPLLKSGTAGTRTGAARARPLRQRGERGREEAADGSEKFAPFFALMANERRGQVPSALALARLYLSLALRCAAAAAAPSEAAGLTARGARRSGAPPPRGEERRERGVG
jgi:hypothetical protein